MASILPLILPIALGLEVQTLCHPTNTFLKIAATAATIGYLIVFIVYKPQGSFGTVWPLGMNIYCLAQRCFNYLWLRQPAQFYKKSHGATKGSMESSVASHSIADALDIALTFRGVGWSFEVKGIPDPPSLSESRFRFVTSQIIIALRQFIVLDLAVTFANLSNIEVLSEPLPVRLMLGAIMLLYVRWTMDIPYRLMSVIAVMTGATELTAWPPLFGAWEDASSIRGFWAHTWHQGMRLLAEPPLNLISHTWMRLPRGSYASKWTRFFGNFFVALLDHAYGRIIAGGNPIHDWNFFVVQPIAIWIEETAREALVICGLLDAKERSQKELLLGYVWTALFECWTFLFFMEGVIRIQGSVPAGVLIEPPFGVSLVRPMLERIGA